MKLQVSQALVDDMNNMHGVDAIKEVMNIADYEIKCLLNNEICNQCIHQIPAGNIPVVDQPDCKLRPSLNDYTVEITPGDSGTWITFPQEETIPKECEFRRKILILLKLKRALK